MGVRSGFSPTLGWFVPSGIPSPRSPVRNRRHSPTNAPGRRRTSVPRLASEATVRAPVRSGAAPTVASATEREAGTQFGQAGRVALAEPSVGRPDLENAGVGRGISPSTGREREGDARASPRRRERGRHLLGAGRHRPWNPFHVARRRPPTCRRTRSVLPARPVRDRSGESVASQGNPGPHPVRRDRGGHLRDLRHTDRTGPLVRRPRPAGTRVHRPAGPERHRARPGRGRTGFLPGRARHQAYRRAPAGDR